MSKKIYIDTLGCAKNEYDSQVLAAGLLAKGCVICDSPEDADILIVNTCGFIEAAKIESIERIFDMARIKGEDKKLVVTGCLSERYHEQLVSELPEVDILVGVNEYDDLPTLLVGEAEGVDNVTGDVGSVLEYRQRMMPQNAHTGVLKIAEGCDNACTFCIIPKIRGGYRSKRMEDVLREAREMAAAGVKEIILIAQDTSYYGVDLYGERKLPELLTELAKVEGIEWIRLMYVYDDGITDELIDVMAREPKVCNYVDMPIQHVANSVLKRMGRKSTCESIKETISKLRAKMPDVHLRTTLLVGFPGEQDQDVAELVSFLEEMRIERVGAFAFSDEEDTAANRMDGKLEPAIKEARLDAVMRAQVAISEALNLAKIGSVQRVIIDEIAYDQDDEPIYIGRSKYDAPEIDNEISFTSKRELNTGDIVDVRIVDAYEYDLVGEEV